MSSFTFPSKVHSLYSENLVPTPFLKQSNPNFHLLLAKLQMRGTLYKTILAQIRPKGETKRHFNQLKYKAFLVSSTHARESVNAWHAAQSFNFQLQFQLVQSTVNEL